MSVGAAGFARAAQDATPAGKRNEQLEVVFTPLNPVSIILAGGGPPQRGDTFYVDGPVYAAGDINGTQIGVYECFGVWIAAADDVDATFQRLTTAQFRLDEGTITGLINEAGTGSAIGVVQGGHGRFAGVSGTFQFITVQPPTPGVEPVPGAPGTPGPGQYVMRAVFDLILPQGS